MTASRRRFILGYAAAWAVFGVLYGLILLIADRPLRLADALSGGFANGAVAALLGVPLVLISSRAFARQWSRRTYLIAAALLIVTYAALWTAIVSWFVVRYADAASAETYLRWGMPWQFILGLLLGGSVILACVLRHSERRRLEQVSIAARAEALRVRAELQALRAQLQPHFLFNALHSITAVVRSDPPAAERALEQLGSMLRYTLGVQRAEQDEVPLQEEVEFVRGYLAIERLRFGDRLQMEEHIDPDALECLMPTLTLQPLVENAVRHAVAPHVSGCTVRLEVTLRDDTLELVVSDDGPGTTAAVVEASTGVGIRAVRQRLMTRFGGSASLEVETSPGRGFTVRVRLPALVSPPHANKRPIPMSAVTT